MFKATANVMLPTSIIGSLPRPAWYTATLGSKSFLEAMVNSRYREQYEDERDEDISEGHGFSSMADAAGCHWMRLRWSVQCLIASASVSLPVIAAR